MKTETITQENFPVDISVIKEYGVDKWQRDFFWPVSDKEFIDLHDDIDMCLTTEIKKQTDQIKRLLVIQCNHLALEYGNYLHVLKVIRKIQIKEMRLLYSNESRWYLDAIKGGRTDFHIQRELPESLPVRGIKTLLVIRLKSFIKTIIYNGPNFIKYLLSFGKKELVKACGSVTPLMRQYINQMGNWVYFTSWHDWISKGRSNNISDTLLTSIRQCTENILSSISAIAQKNDVLLSGKDVAHLSKLTNDRLIETAKVMNGVEDRIKKYKKKIHILLPGVRKLFYRIISLVVQHYGGRVTTFTHGLDMGFFNSYLLLVSRFDLQTTNNFVTYTPKSVELFRDLERNHSHCKEKILNVIPVGSNEYLKIWQRYKDKPQPDKTRRIMIIGHPQYPWRKPYIAGLPLIYFDLELRILSVLKDAGYDVIYKLHPENTYWVEEIFKDRVRVLKGYFEDKLDEADLFLFTHIGSSTFMAALSTNKPVIIFDVTHKAYEIFPKAMDLLKKRCAIINTACNNENRVIFDEKRLLDAVAQKVEKPNMEFMERFVFP